MMQMFEKTSLDKKESDKAAADEKRRQDEEQQFMEYGDEYGFYDPNGVNGMNA
jgi:hypothetical protein